MTSTPRRLRRRPTLRRLGSLLGGLLLLGIATLAGVYWYFARDLPSVEALREYRPPEATRVLCADGSPCGRFFRERRTLVPIGELPDHVKNAFLAAEDADFYEHPGIDFVGLARAIVVGLLPGRRMHGASTISQQACRNLLLSRDRKVSRKIREWILTPRMEAALSKDRILELYINLVNYGHGRYGIEEAARYYFGKGARELSVEEGAVLAGTVQLPTYINPLSDMDRALARRRYVLTQMARHGFLPEEEARAAMERPITLGPRPEEPPGPYYLENVRRHLISLYGAESLYEGGLEVRIAMRPGLQRLADEALEEGLEAFDRRMGFRGPLGRLEEAQLEALRPLLVARLEEAVRRPGEALVYDLAPLADAEVPDGAQDTGPPRDEGAGGEASTNSAPNSAKDETQAELESLARLPRLVPLETGAQLVGRVSRVDDRAGSIRVDLVAREVELSMAQLGWARPRGIERWTAAPKVPSDIVTPGDLVSVQITASTEAPAPLEGVLRQDPEIEGALVALAPRNREVAALVGGYDFERSSFDRATQARRQPGSAFKPFVYGAALGSLRYTTVSRVNDAPESIRDPWTGKVWRPQNYAAGRFDGPLTLREAISKSKNTVSVRLIEAIGPASVIDFARRAGIHSPLPENLTLALGTGEVGVLELANAYATLAARGRRAEPLLVLEVRDAMGRTLEKHEANLEETMHPGVAYLTTSLLESVVQQGTARSAASLELPLAAKTGTASSYRDAWLSGYSPRWVSTVWVGFDDHRSLGRAGTGGGAALPIWREWMAGAHVEGDTDPFEVPEDVVFARVDPRSGLLREDGQREPFLDGTQPTQSVTPGDEVTPETFFLRRRP